MKYLVTNTMSHVRAWFETSVTRTFIATSIVRTLAVGAHIRGFALIDICKTHTKSKHLAKEKCYIHRTNI